MTVNDTICLACHDFSDGAGLHTGEAHSNADCTDCHTEVGDSPLTSTCFECHPQGGPGECPLVDFHDPDMGADCVSCHISCSDEDYEHISICMTCHDVQNLHERIGHINIGCTQCHQTSPDGGIIEFIVDPNTCTACHPLLNPGKCSLASTSDHASTCLTCHIECADGTTTTTSVTGGHEDSGAVDNTLCLLCHELGSLGEQDDTTLHGEREHSDCSQCHSGGIGRGTVIADKCILCHPLEEPGPGKCNLVSEHGDNTCSSCHVECTGPSTTTTTVSDDHLNRCLECHSVNDIHGNSNHYDCAKCHDGGVNFNKCTACHSGCTLPISHGSSCLGCHDECTGPSTTTTVSPFPNHIDTCLECHVVDDLHDVENHSNCNQCHKGDIVEVGACVICHPTDDPGKCNLVNRYHWTCLECHPDCAEPTTTTTESIFAGGGHISVCAVCHRESDFEQDFHKKHAFINSCLTCHLDTPQSDNVWLGACVECHPFGDPGLCNLGDTHDANYGTGCLECHVTCVTTIPPPPSTTTTINSECFLIHTYGNNSEEIELLRYIRDNVLKKTPEGKELINLHYRWSPVIVRAMEADEEFKQAVKEMIDGVLGLIE
ncbi:MAG: CFI-box-CTERM domain-containing protein [Thermodesulfobacteriota bacterium]